MEYKIIASEPIRKILLLMFACLGMNQLLVSQESFSKNIADYTFNLSSLFESESDFIKGEKFIHKKISELKNHQDKDLSKRQNLTEALRAISQLRTMASKMSIYGLLKDWIGNSTKTNNLKNKGKEMEALVEAEVAFVEEVVRSIDKVTLESWIEEDVEFSEFKRRINKITWKAPYTLPSKEQKLIETLSEMTKNPYRVYLELGSSDFGWPSLNLNKQEQTIIDQNAFYKHRRSEEFEIRNKVLNSYFSSLKEQQDVFGKLFTQRIQADVILAKLRHFDNGMDALWYLRDGMPVGSYNRMIRVARENQEVLNRYIQLKKKVLGKPDFNYYDFYAPLPGVNKAIEIDEAMRICVEASKPLGKKYQTLLTKKLNSRLMHLAPKEEKSTSLYGIFPAVGGAHSYTVMTYNNDFKSSSALMGASTLMMAFESIPKEGIPDTGDDPGIYANSMIYLGNFLHDKYLYDIAESKNERISILLGNLEKIWDRFFRYALITEWEQDVQNAIIENKTPSGKELSDKYYSFLSKRYKGIIIPEAAASEWMTFRVPFYSFEHQFWPAAMAATCTILNKLDAGDEKVLEISKVLGRGKLDMTFPLFKQVGIDMTSEESYSAVVERMNHLLDLLEKEMKL